MSLSDDVRAELAAIDVHAGEGGIDIWAASRQV